MARDADRESGDGSVAASMRPATMPLIADGFWTAVEESPGIDLPAERPDLSLLRRLGPIKALDDDLAARLGPLYRAVAASADAALEAADADAADMRSPGRLAADPE